jgi:hypothetical protein
MVCDLNGVAFVLLAGYHWERVPLLAYRSGPATAKPDLSSVHLERWGRPRPERQIRMELTDEW